jgi:phosphocarrier protein HPr
MNAFSDPGSAAAPGYRATGNVVLLHEAGLHARPAVKLTKLAKKFASKIALATSDQGPWIDAKSIVKVMAAKPPRNSILHFRAEGADASAAVAAIVALVERDFSDDG